jgi:hypothetical protein
VLAGPPPAPAAPAADDVDTLLRAARWRTSPSQAAGQVAKAHGLDRKALYARAMALKEPREPRPGRAQGRRGEWLAGLYLMLTGWRVLARRVKIGVGEVDLVARRGAPWPLSR